jgi:ankyrin repeat protein
VSTLDNLRRSARRWLKSIRAGDADAHARLTRAYPGAPANPSLREVQHALARERGHESWIELTRAVAEGQATEPPLTTLLTAAGKGEVGKVAALLDEHPDLIDARGAIGESGLRTALHFGSGHEAVVRLLLERGADPNVRDEGDNAYPLHFAAERGDLAVVRLLVEHGADPVGAGTMHELDVLGWAVGFDYAHRVDVAEYLLAHGASHSLVTAVAMGDVAAIRARAAAGDDLDLRMDRTNLRRTPLHLAVRKRQPASLVTLLELGANANIADASGMTPLDEAALTDDQAAVARLLDRGAQMTLPAAVALGRVDEVERLVRVDPDLVSMTSRERWARLVVHASERASGAALDALLTTLTRYRGGLSVVNVEAGFDTAVDGAPGYTPLHAAAFHGNRETVEVLLRHGADVRMRDGKYRATPAGWADYAGHPDVRDRILAADIDIFDAINFDRGDRVAAVLDADPGALTRPFKAYASLRSQPDQWWPTPETLPLEWAVLKKREAVSAMLVERARAAAGDDVARAEKVGAFVRAACWDHHVHGKSVHRMHDRAAGRLLARDPWMAQETLETAIVCGEIDEVRRILDADPAAATRKTGARGWTPILYLAYTRFTHPPTIANAPGIVGMLLDHGADPDDFYMACDAQYSVLTGIAGEGEQDSPRQPNATELFDLILARGAKPFDIQVLYNTHFSGDILWWLELVYARSVDTHPEAWADPDWHMLDMGAYGCGARFLVETAIKTRRPELAEWCLARGANPNASHARDHRFTRRSLQQFATLEGQDEIAELLAEHGAVTGGPPLDVSEHFQVACMSLDRAGAAALLAANPELRQSPHPMFEAARRDRPDVLALLLDLGFPLEAEDATGKRALHEAAVRNALGAARFLLERGAEVDPLESSYQSPPIGWATHGDHAEMVQLLSRSSRDVWRLAFNGCVERLRDVLAEDPSRARVARSDGTTPLWWLPDEEGKALAVVDLLTAAGADPAAENSEGRTAADWATQRGMFEVADRLAATV